MKTTKERLYRIHLSNEILKIVGIPRGYRVETRNTHALDAVKFFFTSIGYKINIATVNRVDIGNSIL